MTSLSGYINTDLVIESSNDLSQFVKRLERGGLFCLGFREVCGQWRATFESNADEPSPESSIAILVAVTESLEPEFRMDWDKCTEKCFDVGFARPETSFSQSWTLSNQVIEGIVSLGGGVKLTIYRDE